MRFERISFYDPPDWEWHEKHSPGLKKAWKRDVSLDDREFEIGVSGPKGALRVRAWDLAYAESRGYSGRLFYYEEGRWVQKHAPATRTVLRMGGVA